MLFDNVVRVLNEDQQINAPIPSLRAEWHHFERENPLTVCLIVSSGL